MQLRVKYGRGTQEAAVADRRLLAQVAVRAAEPLADPAAAFRRAAEKPHGPRLEEVISRGDRVLVLTVDNTRPNPSPVLWPLMERLEALGARPEIMIGLGNHRPLSEAELDAFLGTHDVHQNDARSADPWRLGTTRHGTPLEFSPRLREADRRVVVGFIEPHYIAGFSGGRKMILPACASRAATTHNHFLTVLHGPQLGRLAGNPVHEDMMEAARAVGVDWICDVVVNPDDSFAGIFCGELAAAHEAGARAAAALYRQTVPRRADIVIASPGGYPYDVDMVQAKKALAPALECVRPGGAVILVGECPRGWGATEPDWDLLRPETALAARREIEESLRQGRVERDWAACSPGALFSRVVHDAGAELILVSALGDQPAGLGDQLAGLGDQLAGLGDQLAGLGGRLAGTYLRPAADLEEALELAQERLGPEASVIVIHEGRRAMCG